MHPMGSRNACQCVDKTSTSDATHLYWQRKSLQCCSVDACLVSGKARDPDTAPASVMMKTMPNKSWPAREVVDVVGLC